MNQIDFYYDYLSHNAYLAWHQLPTLAARHGIGIRPVPVLFAGFLKTYGQLGPAEIEPKVEWMNRNVLRKAAQLDIPIAAPTQHPFRPLLLLRLSALDMPDERRCELTGLLFRAVWVDKVDPNDRRSLRAYLETNRFSCDDYFQRVDDDDTKHRVRANTDECLARGGFGVPTMLVGDTLFWGFDDLDYLGNFLAGDDPLNWVEAERFLMEWGQCRARGTHRARD